MTHEKKVWKCRACDVTFTTLKAVPGTSFSKTVISFRFLQAAIVENVRLYTDKYDEEFEPHLRQFAQAVWGLLMKVRVTQIHHPRGSSLEYGFWWPSLEVASYVTDSIIRLYYEVNNSCVSFATTCLIYSYTRGPLELASCF